MIATLSSLAVNSDNLVRLWRQRWHYDNSRAVRIKLVTIILHNISVQDILAKFTFNSNLLKSCSSIKNQLPSPVALKILHRAGQYHCHTLCKIPKRSCNWSGRYGQTRFRKIYNLIQIHVCCVIQFLWSACWLLRNVRRGPIVSPLTTWQPRLQIFLCTWYDHCCSLPSHILPQT